AKSATANGVRISKTNSTESSVSFLVEETSAPSSPPPNEQPLPTQLQFNRDTLRVENLKSGTYQLTVDEKPVVTATAEEWAKGVAVDSSPAHKAAEKFRKAVNDKNLQFTYSWKALNQVHIVGERKSSPSGRALPREVIEFNELANERDAALHGGIKLKTRRWKLSLLEK
ncbi:dehydrogenase, partial [bacterium]|nr:dehydrogenase [bacterium]